MRSKRWWEALARNYAGVINKFIYKNNDLRAQLSQTQKLVDRLYGDITNYREGLREVRDTAFSLNSDRWKAIRCSEIAHSLLEKE